MLRVPHTPCCTVACAVTWSAYQCTAAPTKVANASGVPVILDAGGAEGPLPQELLRSLTLVSPNETELARMTDMATETEEEVVKAAK